MKVTEKYLIEQLGLLRDALSQRRGDIADAIDSILDGEGFDEEEITPKYVHAKLEEVEGEVYFDSFLAALFYRKGEEDEWTMLDESFMEDDDEEGVVIDDTAYFEQRERLSRERDMSIGPGDIEFIEPTEEEKKKWAEQDAKLDLGYYDRLADMTKEDEERLEREWIEKHGKDTEDE